MTKPITDEQVDRLIESLPPMYDKDFKQSFKNCINQTRNQAIINERERIYKELKEWGFDWVVEKVFKIEKLTK